MPARRAGRRSDAASHRAAAEKKQLSPCLPTACERRGDRSSRGRIRVSLTAHRTCGDLPRLFEAASSRAPLPREARTAPKPERASCGTVTCTAASERLTGVSAAASSPAPVPAERATPRAPSPVVAGQAHHAHACRRQHGVPPAIALEARGQGMKREPVDPCHTRGPRPGPAPTAPSPVPRDTRPGAADAAVSS